MNSTAVSELHYTLLLKNKVGRNVSYTLNVKIETQNLLRLFESEKFFSATVNNVKMLVLQSVLQQVLKNEKNKLQ